MLRYLTAGESHGPALTAIVEGFPVGRRARHGADRPRAGASPGRLRARQAAEARDRPDHRRFGRLPRRHDGGPITLRLINNDAKLERLTEPAAPRAATSTWPARSTTRPASARCSNAPAPARPRCASPSAAWPSCSSRAGDHGLRLCPRAGRDRRAAASFDLAIRDASPVYTLNPEADPAIVAAIDAARDAGDTLGGVVEAIVTGCPIGLGSHAQWDRKLDARLAAAVMSIQAIKAVEIGLGSRRPEGQARR